METAFEKFEDIRNILSDNAILDELEQYMSSYDLSKFVDHLESKFDINF